jgi:hypothetical protein
MDDFIVLDHPKVTEFELIHATKAVVLITLAGRRSPERLAPSILDVIKRRSPNDHALVIDYVQGRR